MKKSLLFAVVWGLLFAVPALFAGSLGEVRVGDTTTGSRDCISAEKKLPSVSSETIVVAKNHTRASSAIHR